MRNIDIHSRSRFGRENTEEEMGPISPFPARSNATTVDSLHVTPYHVQQSRIVPSESVPRVSEEVVVEVE